MEFLVNCYRCGVHKNKNLNYCDCCEGLLDYVKIDDFWYTPEELEKENLYD